MIEIKIACILGEIFGKEINIIPVVLYPLGIKTPDYIINGEKFDLKQIFGNKRNTLYDALTRKSEQANNFIFDITKSKMNVEEAIAQIERMYGSQHRKWVDKIVLIRDNKILKIYERNKERLVQPNT